GGGGGIRTPGARARRFSRPLPSTTRPLLQGAPGGKPGEYRDRRPLVKRIPAASGRLAPAPRSPGHGADALDGVDLLAAEGEPYPGADQRPGRQPDATIDGRPARRRARHRALFVLVASHEADHDPGRAAHERPDHRALDGAPAAVAQG